MTTILSHENEILSRWDQHQQQAWDHASTLSVIISSHQHRPRRTERQQSKQEPGVNTRVWWWQNRYHHIATSPDPMLILPADWYIFCTLCCITEECMQTLQFRNLCIMWHCVLVANHAFLGHFFAPPVNLVNRNRMCKHLQPGAWEKCQVELKLLRGETDFTLWSNPK